MKHKDILALYEASPPEAIRLLNNLMITITELQGAGEAAKSHHLTG
jgi:hypothetical protein